LTKFDRNTRTFSCAASRVEAECLRSDGSESHEEEVVRCCDSECARKFGHGFECATGTTEKSRLSPLVERTPA
jgi:hypothetical protein